MLQRRMQSLTTTRQSINSSIRKTRAAADRKLIVTPAGGQYRTCWASSKIKGSANTHAVFCFQPYRRFLADRSTGCRKSRAPRDPSVL